MGSGAGTSDWSCYSRWAKPLTATEPNFRPLFVMNHFRDVPVQGTVATAGKCLDVNGGGTTNGTIVQLWECNGSGAQQWRVRADGSVQNPQSGLCLDNPDASTTPGTRLNIWACNGSAAQVWRFR